MKKIMTAAIAMMTMLSCSEKDQSKALVLYYSQSGATRTVAEAIAFQTGADIEQFDVEEPYDGTYQETIQRANEERANGKLSKLVPIKSDISEYDVIFLGYPIWYGTYALPVSSLLNEVDFEGKTIVPFCTFGSGGIESSSADLAAALPGSKIAAGYGIRNARISKAVDETGKFLVNNGYKEGEAEVLPDFTEPVDVDEEQAAIFDAACSSYQMPLGTPVKCSSRKTSDGVEYLFIAETVGNDGNIATSKVNIIVGNEEGSIPEFTKVVR